MHRWRNRFSEIEEAESYERDNTESMKKTKSRKRKKLSKKITQTATKRTRKESQNNEFHESNDDWFENYLNYMKEHKNVLFLSFFLIRSSVINLYCLFSSHLPSFTIFCLINNYNQILWRLASINNNFSFIVFAQP